MDTDTNFNVYVGSETGVLKAIYIGEDAATPRLKNFYEFPTKDTTKASKNEIVSLNWGFENDEKELIVGYANNTAKIYSTKLRAFMFGTSLPVDSEKQGKLTGVYNYESTFIFGTTNGSLLTWNFDDDVDEMKVTEISTGSHMEKLQRCEASSNIYATGGKETELQLWNLENPSNSAPIFKAKNVRNDFLDLRVPVWVQDIAFLREATDLVAISTRYGQVRLYDTRADTRPMVDMQFIDHPLMAISTVSSNNRHVLVGSARGTLGLIDLRNTKGGLVRKYPGHAGGVRSISAHPTLPWFASCGLDRHIYFHQLDVKKHQKRLYLKSRLDCVIMSKHLQSMGPHSATENVSADVLPVEERPGSKQARSSSSIKAPEPEPVTKKKRKQ